MVDIRELTDADIDALAQLHVRTWQAGYAGIVPADYLAGLDPIAFAGQRRARAVPSGARTMLAEDGGTLVGFVNYGPHLNDQDNAYDVTIGEIYAIYVDPVRWGGGAGRALIASARDGLKAAGFAEMRLWVLEENHRARRFYERAGMAADGSRQLWTPRGTTVELPELRYSAQLD